MGTAAIASSHITEAFGRGSPRLSVLASASVALLSFFYVYAVGSSFEVRTYPLIDRVTHLTPFDLHVINEYVDAVVIGSLLILWLAISLRKSNVKHIGLGLLGTLFAISAAVGIDQGLDAISLAALPATVSLIAYDRYSPRKILVSQGNGLTINYLAIIGIVTGTIAFAIGIAPVIFGSAADDTPPVRNYAYEIFLLFSSFSPVLILLLITSLPIKLLINYVSGALGKKSEPTNLGQYKKDSVSTKAKIIYLSLFALLSIAMTVIPHLPTINKDNQQIGVDTGYYITWVNGLKESSGPVDFLYQAFVNQNQGDRPLSLIFLYGLDQVTKSELFFTVEYVPLILGSALVIAVYFLTRELTSSDVTSLIAAFITAVSFHTLIGIYAGFYANWLALVLGYLSFVFFFRFLKNGCSKNLALYGILAAMMLFAHVYTWSILSIVSGLFLMALIARPSPILTGGRRNAVLLLVVLLSTVALDVGRTGIIGSSGGVEGDLEVAGTLVDPEHFLLRWNNLSYTATTFVGGLFANFIILGLGLYWLVRTRMQDTTSIFLIIFLSIGILPFLIGEWVIQTRVFYDIPFQIPSAIALAYIAGRRYSNIEAGRGVALLRGLPIFIWLVSMAVIAVSNFHLLVPPVIDEAGATGS